METFSRYWPFVGNSPVPGQWRGALMFSLICAWINAWVKIREAGDLRRNRAHYDVTLMFIIIYRCFQCCFHVNSTTEILFKYQRKLDNLCWRNIDTKEVQRFQMMYTGCYKILDRHASWFFRKSVLWAIYCDVCTYLCRRKALGKRWNVHFSLINFMCLLCK